MTIQGVIQVSLIIVLVWEIWIVPIVICVKSEKTGRCRAIDFSSRLCYNEVAPPTT
jgi:hypothetical protein